MPHSSSSGKSPYKNWKFVKELSKPDLSWFSIHAPGKGRSVAIKHGFREAEDRLSTAYTSLTFLLHSAGYTVARSSTKADYIIETQRIQTSCVEEYTIETSVSGAVVSAADSEGVRRGIYAFIDLMHANGGRFPLAGQSITRKPFLKLRLSRCPYGLVKRWPLNQDELLCDDLDFYPYFLLERFAHDAINGVWIVTQLRELGICSFCEPDSQREKRLARLRQVVERAGSFGIKVFLFMIEPFSIAADDPILEKHPSMKGPMAYNGRHTVCPNSPDTQQYLRELITSVFTDVPGLGGILDINLGERPTSCITMLPLDRPAKIPCQDKCGLEPGQILNKLLTTMNDALHAAAPEAKLVSWYYMPHANDHQPWVEKLADYVPDDVIAQYNFESGGEKTQLGHVLRGVDYWVSYDGPAKPFIASAKRRAGKELSAKLQLGCGYDLATVPFIPAPGIAYRKYKAMQELGVNNVMQAWYPGNFPGIMTNAMGLLAFTDFSQETESQFVRRLASINWGSDAETMALAWEEFDQAYQNFPFSVAFQYYSPFNSMPKWKFHVLPDLEPLAPPWKPNYEIGGDAVGECVGVLSIDECLQLLGAMNFGWVNGLNLILPLRQKYVSAFPRLTDILVAHVIGAIILGVSNIIRFYVFRRQLFQQNDTSVIPLMKTLITIQRSIYNNLKTMLLLDSRIGFHGEALYYVFSSKDMTKADRDARDSFRALEKLEKSPLTPRQYAIENGVLKFIKSGETQTLPGDEHLSATWSVQVTEKSLIFNLNLTTTARQIIFQPYFIDLTGTECEFTEIYRLQPDNEETPIIFSHNCNDYTSGYHKPCQSSFSMKDGVYSFEYPIESLPTGLPKGEFVRFNATLTHSEEKQVYLLNGQPIPGRLYKPPMAAHDALCIQLKETL